MSPFCRDNVYFPIDYLSPSESGCGKWLKSSRKQLSPILKNHGFTCLQTRNNWGWHGDATWVFVIRAVGNYFSQVTGWPPMSISVEAGVYYDCIPFDGLGDPPIKRGPHGELMPKESYCQFRYSLTSSLDQSGMKTVLENPGERARNNIWWIEPNGSNIEAVIANVAEQFVKDGHPWLMSLSDFQSAFNQTLRERDCWVKFRDATFLARAMGAEDQYEISKQKLVDESIRIDKMDILKLLD